MDVSNGTGEGTDYRTGSGTPKASTWTRLPDKSTLHCPDAQPPSHDTVVEFRLPSGKILSATYNQPMASVSLVKNGSSYVISAVTKPFELPVEKPGRKVPIKPPAKAKAKSAA